MKIYDTNPDVTVHWFPEKCIHARNCVNSLPGVFDFERRPWIICDNATPEEIIAAIDTCPSGALRYSLPAGSKVDPKLGRGAGAISPAELEEGKDTAITIRLLPGGPLFVEGPVAIFDENGQLIKESGKVALCRCGLTQRIPFCDGSHQKKE